MSQLVVSFVGRTDLMAMGVIQPGRDWNPDVDMSPILRLVLHLSNNGLFQRGSRVLLFDDHPENSERTVFRERLAARLQEYKLDATIELQPFVEPAGPTNYDALFKHVWDCVPHGVDMRKAEVCFHLTSGTAAMQTTLMLAAMCMPLDAAMMFETSREKECLEVRLPYVVAVRRRRERIVAPGAARLGPAARKSLMKGTVVQDDEVERQFVALHRAATRSKQVPRIVISGPTGCGKTWAARQFAHWAGRSLVEWTVHDLGATNMPDLGDDCAVVVKHLEEASADQLRCLRGWVDRSPRTPWLVTFRTDRRGPTSRQDLLSDGMPGAAEVLLPDSTVRTDIVELAEAIARELGLWDTKVKERLQHEVFTASVPAGLHSLKSMLATASMHSASRHVDNAAFDAAHRTREATEAAAMLMRLGERLAALRLVAGGSLEQLLEAAKAPAARLALAGGRTQARAADLLGCSQQSVSEWSRDEEGLETLRKYLQSGGDV